MRWVWGKAGKGDIPHPLICHMIDTAHVALRLLEAGLPGSFGGRLSRGVEEPAAKLAIAFVAGAHDIGKCSCWQMKRDDLLPTEAPSRIPQALWESLKGKVPHGLMTDVHLRGWLVERFGLAPDTADLLATAAGGHHGEFFNEGRRNLLKNTTGDGVVLGGADWAQLRDRLLGELAERLGVDDTSLSAWKPDVPDAVLLTGLTAVSDWIASDERRFPYVGAEVDLDDYMRASKKRAEEAIDALGWARWRPARRAFPDLLPKNARPRAAQRTVMEMADEGMFDEPGIVIVEDAMGGGKTEIAQYAVAEWTRRLGLSGFFFALPTQATSNQMLDRLQTFLGLHSASDALLHLVHGAAGLNDEFLKLLAQDDPRVRAQINPSSVHAQEGPKAAGNTGVDVTASRWFTARWRGLLAPCGVGTVDQILRAGLRIRHNAVLHFGLSGKVVVIDEVHAYDLYMSTILDRVLEWLGRQGVPVVLLSATLPSRRRLELMRAWQRGAGREALPPAESEEPDKAPYPLVSWGTATTSSFRQPDPPQDSSVVLDFSHAYDSDKELARWLATVTADGGCVAVIRNTVGRAQSLYKALRAAGVRKRDLILFHARFPHARRHELERQVLRLFGKKGRRPKKKIVIATQVVEQSLDIDFDLMITDHAPVDLLLQRAGRLHRHDRAPEARHGFVAPRIVVTGVSGVDPVGFPTGSTMIYGSRLLIASWYALKNLREKGRAEINLPGDIRTLTEEVYGGDPPPNLRPADVDAYAVAVEEEESKRDVEELLAGNRCVPGPDGDKLHLMTELAENEEKDSQVTRLGMPSVNIVLLEEVSEGVVRPVTGGDAFSLNKSPNRKLEQALIQSSLSVSTPVAFARELFDREPCSAWRWTSWLRDHRALVLKGGRAQIGSYEVTYDEILGLQATGAAKAPS
ncbi:CRISPR-associated helicase Cas3' [Streptosporangium sp. NPDC049046]|uniref:CRISPR-associated helicase Cas3' n=1 Tax=Streptosporangium sp. NPDC049046 TaxID=3155031 RepID=UPI003447AFFB